MTPKEALVVLYNNLKSHMSKDNPMFDLEFETVEKVVSEYNKLEEEFGTKPENVIKALQPYNSAIKTKNGKFFDEKYQRHLICQGPYYIEFYKDGKYEGAISPEKYGKTWVFAGEKFKK